MRHRELHPDAGKTVLLRTKDQLSGSQYRIEDWCDRVLGISWMDANGNPAALVYAMRSAGSTPIDDEVVYGKIANRAHLMHVSELGDEVTS